MKKRDTKWFLRSNGGKAKLIRLSYNEAGDICEDGDVYALDNKFKLDISVACMI